MARIRLVAFALSVVLAACQSAAPSPEDVRVRMMSMKPAIDSVPKSALGAQELQPGECGLFLWSQTDVSKFIFFSKALSERALFAQGELPIVLEQTTAGGDIFGQFNTRMGYVSEDGRRVEFSMIAGEVLDGGQRITDGLLSLMDKDGWQTKMPVLGVRACQQE